MLDHVDEKVPKFCSLNDLNALPFENFDYVLNLFINKNSIQTPTLISKAASAFNTTLQERFTIEQ